MLTNPSATAASKLAQCSSVVRVSATSASAASCSFGVTGAVQTWLCPPPLSWLIRVRPTSSRRRAGARRPWLRCASASPHRGHRARVRTVSRAPHSSRRSRARTTGRPRRPSRVHRSGPVTAPASSRAPRRRRRPPALRTARRSTRRPRSRRRRCRTAGRTGDSRSRRRSPACSAPRQPSSRPRVGRTSTPTANAAWSHATTANPTARSVDSSECAGTMAKWIAAAPADAMTSSAVQRGPGRDHGRISGEEGTVVSFVMRASSDRRMTPARADLQGTVKPARRGEDPLATPRSPAGSVIVTPRGGAVW